VTILNAALEISRFRVSGSEQAGLLILDDSQVVATDGEITANEIGLNVRQEGFDPTTLGERLLIHGNETDVARRDIAPPDPSEAVRWSAE
jgi:hypothetical protein